MKDARINTLLAKRNALANELRHTRRGQFELQHQIDALSTQIAELSAMPSLDISDIAPPALNMLAGGLGLRRRRILK